MAELPADVKRTLEAALYNRSTELDAAREILMLARAKAYAVGAPMTAEELPEWAQKNRGVNPAAIRSRGGDSNPTARRAEAVLQAEERYKRAAAWEGVFRELDTFYAGTRTADVVRLKYLEMMSERDIAARIKANRCTVRHMREDYMIRLALLAAGKGLVNWN